MKRWGPRVSSWIPLRLWHALCGVELLLPYYHGASDQPLAHVGPYGLKPVKQFKDDLAFLLSRYVPVALEDVIAHLDGRQRLPKQAFLLTFDDGFRELHDVVAPILAAKGVPAVFFIITRAIDNRMLCDPQKKSLLNAALATCDVASKQTAKDVLLAAGIAVPDLASTILRLNHRQRHLLDELGPILGCDYASYLERMQPFLTSSQVNALARQGFEIGAHSLDHPPYAELDLEEQLRQTRESMDWIAHRFKLRCRSFSFPFRDVGVPREFFERAFADGRLEVSFGTNGMMRHACTRNLERNTMENTSLPAKQVLAREFAVTMLRNPRRAAAQ